MRLFLAFTLILISAVVLEMARLGVDITRNQIGKTPVTHYTKSGGDGPVVVIAHGFAGSEQMMQGYALPLARAGYRVYAFDFLGHGRHTLPMSGDVSSVDGTTRLLVEQTNQVLDAVAQDEGEVALIGHSMATDVLVRVVQGRTDIGPVVLISAFSNEIDARTPSDLLLVAGAWESGLRQFALSSLQMVDVEAREGDTAVNGVILRRAVAAPFSEHVSVLQSRTARREALDWLDRAFERVSEVVPLPTGWAIFGVLTGLVLAFRSLCTLLKKREVDDLSLSLGQTVLVLSVPMIVVPIFATTLNFDLLPVLVADYLVLHMLVFGVVQLIFLRIWRISFGPFDWQAFGLLVMACAVFGFALDRYAANFWPTGNRVWIIAAMTCGTVPYMLADCILTTNQSILRRAWTRASFLISVGIAVALDFEGLFFLLLIAPVLILFYVFFGTMGRATARQSGQLSAGLALGLVLAWALGVSFPLFQT